MYNENLIETIKGGKPMTKKEYINQLLEEIYDLLRNKRDLQEKIDKAINYIDNNSYEETYTDENGITWLRFKMNSVNDLKYILLGEKNER